MASKRQSLREIGCETWSDLLLAVQKAERLLDAKGEALWFRGSGDGTHELLPSLMRDTLGLSLRDHDEVEGSLFFEFQARSAELRRSGLSDWEYLFYGRHYTLPTRLLDWSDTFGVALYFALEGWHTGGSPRPCVWVLNPYLLNERMCDDRDIILPRYLGLVEDDYLDFGELLAADGVWGWDGPIAIYPIQLNERVRAQRGWFTIHGNDRRPLEKQAPDLIVKITLSPTCANDCQDFLRLAGVNRFSIYPDLENLAKHIRSEKLAWIAGRQQKRTKRSSRARSSRAPLKPGRR